MSYEFSFEAEADLLEIAAFIAKNNPPASRKLIADIQKACERLARKPSLGHPRRDLTSDREILFFCVREYYLVIYRKGTDPLQIARVLHGARDVEDELADG